MPLKKRIAHSEARIPQVVPETLRDEALHYIRAKFYGSFPEARFYQDRALLLRFVVFWPAKWFRDKGVTISMERYRDILLHPKEGVLPIAATLGDIPRNPVAYLGKAVENRFHHKGEQYYEEAKGLSARLDPILAVLSGMAAKPNPEAEHLKQMAEAARQLASAPRRKAKPTVLAAPKIQPAASPSASPAQLGLF